MDNLYVHTFTAKAVCVFYARAKGFIGRMVAADNLMDLMQSQQAGKASL
jgi:hypothetical protein